MSINIKKTLDFVNYSLEEEVYNKETLFTLKENSTLKLCHWLRNKGLKTRAFFLSWNFQIATEM